jgi:hypothetical protein
VNSDGNCNTVNTTIGVSNREDYTECPESHVSVRWILQAAGTAVSKCPRP